MENEKEFTVTLTQREWAAIIVLLHDSGYSDGNEPYLVLFDKIQNQIQSGPYRGPQVTGVPFDAINRFRWTKKEVNGATQYLEENG